MSVRSKHLTLGGALGAAVLTAGLAVAPSAGAVVANLTATGVQYSCLNDLTRPTADFSINPPSTTNLVAGQKLTMPGQVTVHLPGGATNLMLSPQFGWDHFTGTVTSPLPSTKLGVAMTVPMTAVSAPNTETTAQATGNAVLRYSKAGSFAIEAGDFTATLQGYSGGNKKGSPVPVGCVAPTDGTGVLKDGLAQPVTMTVVKDASKTVAKAKYAAAKHQATGTAIVKGKNYGLIGSGKVTFILKKGTKTIATHTGKLNKKGVATTLFKSVSKKGKWSITAKFPGNGGLKPSSGKAPFTV